MKLTAIVSALFVASATAFAPASGPERTSTALNMDRRSAVNAMAAFGVAAIPAMASADGAVSAATIQRSKFVYGQRIAALADAVAKGDFSAVAAEKNAFVLFNSGAYPTIKNKQKKAAAIAGTNAIFSAIRSKDKGALKQAYEAYVEANDIRPADEFDSAQGQGYSGDYDYRVRTKQGVIYVR